MSLYSTMRLVCECGRNLADMTAAAEQQFGAAHRSLEPSSAETGDGRLLRVIPRTANVSVFTHPRAMREWPGWEPRELHDYTYTFVCRCGRQHERRYLALDAHWSEHVFRSPQRVVRCVVGYDL